jgi:hypothetical protein
MYLRTRLFLLFSVLTKEEEKGLSSSQNSKYLQSQSTAWSSSCRIKPSQPENLALDNDLPLIVNIQDIRKQDRYFMTNK